MPDRRIAGSGRRADDPKAGQAVESPAPPQEPTKTEAPKAEVEPNRAHFLHRKIGGGKKAA